jgi:cytochrome o ubiquinol oxidase operon protein cyoD
MSNQQDAHFEFGNRQKTFKAYLTGLLFSFFLTLGAFGLVFTKIWDDASLYIGISVLAITQLIVQSICFLRLNASPAGRWNLFPFLFTLMIITFLAGGSLWIMYNLNYNMT